MTDGYLIVYGVISDLYVMYRPGFEGKSELCLGIYHRGRI
jgi:hypothetical protein